MRKIRCNRARDAKINRLLRAEGWQVLRLWEHDLKPALARRSIRRVQRLLAR